MKRTQILQTIEGLGSQVPGTKFLIKHLYGEPLSRAQAMSAKCSDCCGYYKDGKEDCRIPDCPMYLYMPYREKKEKKPGSRLGKVLSEEQKLKMQKGRDLWKASKMTSNGPG